MDNREVVRDTCAVMKHNLRQLPAKNQRMWDRSLIVCGPVTSEPLVTNSNISDFYGALCMRKEYTDQNLN